MITRIEDYFAKGCGRCDRFATPQCSTRQWAAALMDLRRICRAAGLTETVKWGHPCYTHAGRNVALIGAFQGDCRLSFFNAALMKDPDHILEKPGPNTQYPNLIRFTDNEQVARMEAAIAAYLKEAMDYALAGTAAPKEKRAVELPEELIDALDADPQLAEAFHNLTPGRQRSYVINLNTAKAAATRMARITKFRNHIIAGKGANER
jgi:uncharacterized protein YdeI (YjbR/CyaY-like superfamily)